MHPFKLYTQRWLLAERMNIVDTVSVLCDSVLCVSDVGAYKYSLIFTALEWQQQTATH